MLLALFILFVLFLFVLNICMAQLGKAGVLAIFVTTALLLCGSTILEYVVEYTCEATLPRDKSCVIVAIPEDKVESVTEMLK